MNDITKIKVSAIIPTYNRCSILTRCLDSLHRQTLPPTDFEIIIVDDGSTDRTREIVQNFTEQTDISVQYIKQENKGPAAARNTGISHARGKIIWITGDDYIIDENCLMEHVKWHEKFPGEETVILGYATWHPELDVSDIMYWVENGGIQFYYYKLVHGSEISYFQFITCNISFRKTFFDQWGPFNEKYPAAMGEDTDMGIRFAIGGMKFLYNKNAVAYHYHPITEHQNFQRGILLGQTLVTQMLEWPGFHVLGYHPSHVKRFLIQTLIVFDKTAGNVIRKLPLKMKRPILNLIFKAYDKKAITIGIRKGLEEALQSGLVKPSHPLIYLLAQGDEEAFYRWIAPIQEDHPDDSLGLLGPYDFRTKLRLKRKEIRWIELCPEKIDVLSFFSVFRETVKHLKMKKLILVSDFRYFDWKTAVFFKLCGVNNMVYYSAGERNKPVSWKTIFYAMIKH